MTTLTIQPSDADSYIEKNIIRNQGTSGFLQVFDNTASSYKHRTLVRFDFSALPAGSVISSATLSLYNASTSAEGRTYVANRLTQTGWVESQVTWNDYATSTAWALAGGDFTATDAASSAVPASFNWMDFNVLTLVEYFVANDSSIANFIIKDDLENNSTTSTTFYSSENASPNKPKLVIEYTPPSVDGTITLPQLSLSAFSSPGVASLSLPVFAVLGYTGATGVITFPQFSVAGYTGATSVIAFPQFSVAGYTGATSVIALPGITLSSQGHETNEASLTLPIIIIDAVPPPSTITLPTLSVSAEVGVHVLGSNTLPQLSLSATGNALRGVAQITFPKLKLSSSALSGTTEGTTLNLPAFTISIRAGLTVSNSLPQLSLAATGQSGIVGTYNKRLPRMTVNVKATQQSRGISSTNLPIFTLDATLKTGEISLASTRNFPGLRLGATGYVGVPGDVDLTFPAFELATFGYQSLSGTVVQSLKMITINAYADTYTNRII